MSLLKLIALDSDDLEIVSAHMQDAVLKIGDLDWRSREKRFALKVNRFAWEKEMRGGLLQHAKPAERHQAVLHFERVLAVSLKGINLERSNDVLSLLTIQYHRKAAGPEGFVVLLFSGQAAIRLQVECIEAQLTDLGAMWQASSLPKH